MARYVRLGVVAVLIIICVGMAGLGIKGAAREQSKFKWVYVGGTLLAFGSGFMVAETVLGHLHRSFQFEVNAEEKKVGRPLSGLEIREVGARFREKRQQGGTNIPFPLQRLVTRILLLLPAFVLVSFIAVLGAFLSGFFLAGFIEEYQKRTLPYF